MSGGNSVKSIGLAACLLAGGAVAQPIFTEISIDPFEDGAIGGAIGGGINESVTATVVGGTRFLMAEVISNPIGTTEDTFVDVMFDEGSFVFDTGPRTIANATLMYGDGENSLGLPLSPGFSQFDIDFATVDRAFEFSVLLEDGDGGSASGEFLVNEGIGFPFSFNIFTQLDRTDGYLFSETAKITFVFNTGGVDSLDFRIDDISVSGFIIPAPGSAAVLALGGLVAGRRRRG